MARRKQDDGILTGLMELTALMPWWIGVALAIGSYLFLHQIAVAPVVATTNPSLIGAAASGAIWRALASIGQYILPLVFSVGAIMSAFKQYQANQLHADVANRADGLAQISWREFEVLVGEYFRRQGFEVIEGGGNQPDGGIDVHLRKGSDRYLVQCKHWRARRVGVEPVREMYGVMAARRVAGGYVVTSGDFTPDAVEFAKGRELLLINGKALRSGIKGQAGIRATPAAASARRADGISTRNTTPIVNQPNEQDHLQPLCPICEAPMVIRQARTGPNAGNSFWGCSQFAKTKCKGTRTVT